MTKDNLHCACETSAHGDLGPIDGRERLARVVTHPNHFRKDGTLKPGVFPLSHIRTSGLSLIRMDKIGRDELARQATAVAGANEREELRGVCVSTAEQLRSIVDEEERRSLCVREDPVLDHPRLPDNPAHAIAVQACVQAGGQDEPEVLRIQGELIKLFTRPIPIDDLDAVQREPEVLVGK